MTRLLISACFVFLSAGWAAAEESDGPSPMERGLELFLDGLLDEMDPALKDMKSFVEQMGPALQEILEDVKDWSSYQPPEIMPNGDIIIRRKTPLEPDEEPKKDGEDEQIDL
jgi:hypothetical protein